MDEKLVKRFTEKAEALSAEVFRYKNKEAAYDKVAEVVKKESVSKVGCVAKGLAEGIPQRLKNDGIEIIDAGDPQEIANLEVGITPVDVGIAETGTVAHDATDLYMRLFSMLPPIHIALLETSMIKPDMSSALEIIRKNGGMPGYTAFISGPSRTADIERVLTIGVHGPGRLLIILVDGEER